MGEHKELIERLEALDGPDRGVMWAAYDCVFGWEASPWPPGKRRRGPVSRFSDFIHVRAWESAALLLVPEGWNWLVRNDIYERGSFANVSRQNANNVLDRFDEESRSYTGSGEGHNYARAATPAIAIVIASLKAKGEG